MIIAIDASTVEATMPNAGTPFLDMCLNRAASGISAQIMVQPLSAPNPEMMTATAMTLPAQVPPKIALAASENGALASASFELGMMPNTAISDSMYTTAVAIVPRMVA